MGRTWLLVAAIVVGSSAQAHEWYTGLRSPAGWPCCNDVDCGPVVWRYQGGGVEVRLHDQWWDALDPRWYVPDVIAPDGDWHGCMMPADTQPRCTMGPLNGT